MIEAFTPTNKFEEMYYELFTDFTKQVDYGNGEILFFEFQSRFCPTSYEYLMSHENFETVTNYYKQSVLPHKVAVFQSGVELYEKIQSFVSFKLHITQNTWKTRLLLHDLSKFSLAESSYAFYNFKDKESNDDNLKKAFAYSWHHHKVNNEHHPEYWFDVQRDGSTYSLPMSYEATLEMVADWMGAGKTYGSSLVEWLPGNLHHFSFHSETALFLSNLLYSIGIMTNANGNKIQFVDVL